MAGAGIEFDVEVPMRDGVVLRADVFRPVGAGPWPVLVVRTPYDKQDPRLLGILNPLAAVRRGYIVTIVDTRGRYASDGDWAPLRYERADGHDTVRWAAALSGSTGRVGMYGPSYLGNVQWQAALSRPPELAAIVPLFTWADPTNGLVSRGGARELGLGGAWALSQGPDLLRRRFPDQAAVRAKRLQALVADLDTLAGATYWELPTGFARGDQRSNGAGGDQRSNGAGGDQRGNSAGGDQESNAFPPILRHEVPDVTADEVAGEVAGHYDQVDVPVFNVGGWFDCFLQGTLDNHVGLRAAGRPSTLLVGPWSHSNQGNQQGEVNFGLAGHEGSIGLRSSLHDLQLDFLDHWLRDRDVATAAVRLFVTGVNAWRDEDDWPLERAVETPLFLGANGSLSLTTPTVDGSPDCYRYDPADPVITHGGAVLMASDYPPGPLDQSRVEARPDVLVYTSPELTDDLEVTGRLRVHLYAESSAPTTDWVARLCDVDANGVSRNLADGIIRVPVGPTGVAEHEIDLWSIAHVFRAGHRLRLQITSSNFPRWDRNLNTGHPTELAIADQRIHHGTSCPSRIVLPIVAS